MVTEAATRYLVDLLGMNSTLVENDLDTRVQESRLRLEAELQAALREVYLGVERALTRAQAAHAAGAAEVQEAVAHLDTLDARLDAIAG